MADQYNTDNNRAPQSDKAFESDTQRLVRQHLQDKDHVISEEEMRSLRVGMTPPLDEENKETIEVLQNRVDEKDSAAGEQLTSWDVVDPEK